MKIQNRYLINLCSFPVITFFCIVYKKPCSLNLRTNTIVIILFSGLYLNIWNFTIIKFFVIIIINCSPFLSFLFTIIIIRAFFLFFAAFFFFFWYNLFLSARDNLFSPSLVTPSTCLVFFCLDSYKEDYLPYLKRINNFIFRNLEIV